MQSSHVSSGGSLVDMALTLWGLRNRLHTHAGARWSVVFYAAANVGQSGSLLLVPKHSQSATDHELTLEERAFLRRVPQTTGINNPNATCMDGTSGVCHYLEVPPIPGSIVIFPAWLLHAVMPGSKEAGDSYEPRVSVAFNFG